MSAYTPAHPTLVLTACTVTNTPRPKLHWSLNYHLCTHCYPTTFRLYNIPMSSGQNWYSSSTRCPPFSLVVWAGVWVLLMFRGPPSSETCDTLPHPSSLTHTHHPIPVFHPLLHLRCVSYHFTYFALTIIFPCSVHWISQVGAYFRTSCSLSSINNFWLVRVHIYI